MTGSRRNLLKGAMAATIGLALAPMGLRAKGADVATKPIPSTGEALPLVGLGSWITFNVGNDPKLLAESKAVIAAFFEAGGRLIDSSPMYGSSQSTIGYCLEKLDYPEALFSADKVWTSYASNGPSQIEATRKQWRLRQFDLLQVHNLLSWKQHLKTLFAMKAAGSLRYVGVTTSHGRRHSELERVMAEQPLDFVQVTYNILDRDVEQRILPLARERGIAVIANRPFRTGQLIHDFERHPLPEMAREIGARSWAQFLLKFIVSHPAVTCAIPATTRVDHVRENVAAATGFLPDRAFRARMVRHIAQL